MGGWERIVINGVKKRFGRKKKSVASPEIKCR